ncbi:lysosome membrane protein 2c [Tachysurus ichikawai]
MSSPHFYQADKKFSDDVFGMRPTKEEHQTAIDINPLTGLVVQAAKRLQVNVFIEKLPAFRSFSTLDPDMPEMCNEHDIRAAAQHNYRDKSGSERLNDFKQPALMIYSTLNFIQINAPN